MNPEVVNNNNMAVVGQYRGVDVYLIEEYGTWFISFGSSENHHYWLDAFRTIYEKYPGYKFTTEQGLEVDTEELKPLIKIINNLVKMI